ncbi:programmed cell death protein 2 [Latimeria chalumnae]|uniref:Programmed cell death protein 2 n=1 Tax=Latimeria chalumnae TaxID=7897 RepID=H3AAF0_LATCH|nr:PREDICTED: programmed cell death protein 2 isoform X1 [Latimeria chalumnae]|eukprot:XP_014342327.1 PREDICTED: programmed cell death protein 2 isoform X1 [Latimeria chalumnae]
MAASSSSGSGVELGFVEEAKPWRLQSSQFPSKVGGKPAWLSQQGLPGAAALQCESCGRPCALLLQVYAPLLGQADCFHRSLFVFACKTAACYSTSSDSRCFKVFRSQLPRRNAFYSYDPPPEEEPHEGGVHGSQQLTSGLKLCRVCGCLGPKTCSRCHNAHYCSKDHQTLDWKAGHKQSCSQPGFSDVAVPDHKFLFREYELVTEPEELPPLWETNTEEKREDLQKHVESVAGANNGVVFESLDNDELEAMAKHETKEDKVFKKFKKLTSLEPDQVLRYCRRGSPLWVSAENIPKETDIPNCSCGAKRIFEFQVMPQLLNHLQVDSLEESIDWGTLAVYTCAESCRQDSTYMNEFLWKQDFSADSN